METLKKYIPKNWKEITTWALGACIVTVLTAYGCIPQTPIPTPPVPVFEKPEITTGWVSDPEAVAAIQEKLQFKVFSDTPAGQAIQDLPKSMYLWQCYEKLFARPPPSKNQLQVGSCVGFGTSTAIERTQAAQIVANKGGSDEFRTISPEVIYGGSRVQVGKGQIGRGDGSVGSWAAVFAKDFGYVSQEKHGSYDLTTYLESRCREFGNTGVPADLLAICKERKVKDFTFCKSWAEVKQAIANGYGIAICSNAGFESPRDKNGVKQQRGSWGHCMCIDGYHSENGKDYAHFENSWGPRPNEGPVGWGNPPDSGFYVDAAIVDRLCKDRNNEVIAFSNVATWPPQHLDWFVRREPANINIFALRKKEHDRCDFRLAL